MSFPIDNIDYFAINSIKYCIMPVYFNLLFSHHRGVNDNFCQSNIHHWKNSYINLRCKNRHHNILLCQHKENEQLIEIRS